MNDLKEKINNSDTEVNEGFLKKTARLLTEGAGESSDRRTLIFDLILFTIGMLFARCHLFFGAHPLGLAYLSVLPIGMLPAAAGVAVGALTLGKDGIIYALISVIAVFLRVIISGGKEGQALFGENLLLRMSSATISGFVGAVYEILLNGFSQTTILFGASMILVPPALTFIFSGIFSTGFTLNQLLYATGNIFSLSKKRDAERYNSVFFQASALTALFFISLSLAEIELLGISGSYIFVSFATLIVARRFGALRALAVGFFSSLGISGVFAVSFALAGLGAGLLFGFGLGYGLVGGFMALSAWSAYSAGLTGFLTTLPEFLIAATLSVPILKSLTSERSAEDTGSVEKNATDMVSTMALTYRGRYSHALDSLEASLNSLSSIMKDSNPTRLALSNEEYEIIIDNVNKSTCKSCSELPLCSAESINPCQKNKEIIASILREGDRLSPSDINTDTEFCHRAEEICERLCSDAANAECESFRKGNAEICEEFGLISELIGEARTLDDAERSVNPALTDKLTALLEKRGFSDWAIKAFGERRIHIILAGEDPDGERITSQDLKAAIEECVGIRLGPSQYFRRENMALMECDGCDTYRAECAYAKFSPDKKEISGDSVSFFETSGKYFYALISDGMGRGDTAQKTSDFVCKFMRCVLDFGASKDAVLHLLNRSLRRGKEECSATLDLFELDLMTAEATFIKSGACASFVKRGSSIFRIKSQTAPLGLLTTIDSEKIRVEVNEGDFVIMMSDGVCQSSDDAPWLAELLSSADRWKEPKELAELIIDEAKRNKSATDDMSVAVVKIGKIRE